ncbi:MAG: PD-(D/E)XK nuclease family protein [Leptolyngbya sp. RL_3_1]|nr:PD-(D/E)XK nuclease family protein [Leptolyngbya sp. RL_3_1]
MDYLSIPASPQLLEGQLWGERFHLFMQQQEMGLPMSAVMAQDSDLQACVDALQLTGTTLFGSGELFRHSEYEQAFTLNGYRFTVIYDLLRVWNNRSEIVDWKTYLKPRKQAELKRNWQTRLYLYALVESTDLAPEQVEMTYWFVRTRNQINQVLEPQHVQIAYSQDRHEQTHQDLLRITEQLTDWLGRSQPFPQVPETMERCGSCPFVSRCRRNQDSREVERVFLPDLGRIKEVTL